MDDLLHKRSVSKASNGKHGRTLLFYFYLHISGAGDLNPEPHDCLASALPMNHTPAYL
jgi:hypothetical protein